MVRVNTPHSVLTQSYHKYLQDVCISCSVVKPVVRIIGFHSKNRKYSGGFIPMCNSHATYFLPLSNHGRFKLHLSHFLFFCFPKSTFVQCQARKVRLHVRMQLLSTLLPNTLIQKRYILFYLLFKFTVVS